MWRRQDETCECVQGIVLVAMEMGGVEGKEGVKAGRKGAYNS